MVTKGFENNTENRIIRMTSKKKNFPFNKSKKIIMAYGHFSSIHPGHIRYLKYAKSLGQILIVALIGDSGSGNANRFKYSASNRAEGLLSLNMCDYIIELDNDDLASAIKEVNPKHLVLGTELKNNQSIEIRSAIETSRSQKVKVIFHAGEIQYASTDLLRDNESVLYQERRDLFFKACERQNISPDKLASKLDKLKNCKMLVIGDTIIDQYTACEAIGMSAESPVIVVRELKDRIFIGGAAVVAAHVRALGSKCTFVSVVGDDQNGSLTKSELEKLDIEASIVIDKSRPTTFKKRYMVENQKLFRVSRIEEHELDYDIEEKVIQILRKNAPFIDGIIISDFTYGVITQRINEEIMSLVDKYSIGVYADLQCSSQIGSITKFVGVNLLTPNEREARLALQDKVSGIQALANILINKTNCQNLIMKLDSQGFIVYEKDKTGNIINQHYPALSINPLDVTGAGDSLLALISTCLSSKINIMEASALACFMSAIAVETIGNKPINQLELKKKIIEYTT